MRPFSVLFRVSLFAVGFGIGLSHYKPRYAERPLVLEIHLAKQDVPAYVRASPPSARCTVATSLKTITLTN
jgi:hypothetical protein